MIRKVIFKKHGYLQLLLTTIGTALGIFVLLAGIQFYNDLRTILVDKQMATSDFLVLHKKVSDLSMFKLKSNDFSTAEIEEIRQQPFIHEMGEIQPGLFEVQATLKGVGKGLQMNTAMYFEAIDNMFIDLKSEKWHWKEGDSIIPIILPSLLLESYNFGMAPSQNLPPITEKTLTRFYYTIDIRGNGNRAQFKGIIVGFSDRLNSILVPKQFLDWANEHFRYKEIENPSQLVIKVDDITNPKLAKFLTDKGYETNQEKLRGSKIKTVLNISLFIMLGLGAVILLLAGTALVQYAIITLLKVREDVKILLAIGYHPRQIAPGFILLFGLITLFSLLLAIGGLWYFKQAFSTYFDQYYFSVDANLSTSTIYLAILTVIVFFLANVLSVYRLLKSLAKRLQ